MWKKDGETAGSIIPSTDGAKDGEIIAFVGKGVTFRGAISYEGTSTDRRSSRWRNSDQRHARGR